MENVLYGIMLSVIAVLAVRLTARADDVKHQLAAAFMQMIAAIAGAKAIIIFVADNSTLWWYVAGIGIGSYIAIILAKKWKS